MCLRPYQLTVLLFTSNKTYTENKNLKTLYNYQKSFLACLKVTSQFYFNILLH